MRGRLHLLEALGSREVHQHELAAHALGLADASAVRQALHRQHEDAVRPRGVAVARGLHEGAALLPLRENLAQIVGRADRHPAQVVADEGVAVRGVLLHLQLPLVLRQQIDELLAAAIPRVDLQERGLYEEHLAAGGPVANVLEDLQRDPLRDTHSGGVALLADVLWRPRHRVRLTRARHAVGEDGASVAFHDVLHDPRSLFEHILLAGLGPEEGVAPEGPRVQAGAREPDFCFLRAAPRP
mmetsp:Transcript_64220/g.168080  ORF Transcript_64220/g.168080 Transcript_64220/m.168080 type:complete len:241 (+) Transcript_64220:1542-2264(+)